MPESLNNVNIAASLYAVIDALPSSVVVGKKPHKLHADILMMLEHIFAYTRKLDRY